jgi:hypothetical protein
MPTPDTISDKADLLRAFDYSLSFFKMWNKEGRLRDNQFQRITEYYDGERKRLDSGEPPAEPMRLPPAKTCWSCRGEDTAKDGYCLDCGAPMQTAEVQRLHYLIFLCHEIKKHEQAGRLSFQSMHDLLREGNERIAAMRRQLDGKRIPMVDAGYELVEDEEPPKSPAPILERAEAKRRERPRPRRHRDEGEPPLPRVPRLPRRDLMEILLDPRSIQWLLASGGVLLVLGLIIWLWTQDIFHDPLVLAGTVGVANLSLLAGGWTLVFGTRFQMAGRALTLLACLLLPFNLWFWDHHDLVKLQGGHLWVGALVCCVLYAVSARLLKDRVFVYVFVGGVTLTGLLFLIDVNILHIKEIVAPASAFLVICGLLCIHAERVFPDVDSPFSRKRFGLSFFWAGHFVLASGLLLLLGAQITGWMLQTVPEPRPPDVTAWISDVTYDLHVQYIAILLTVLGVYGYLYSDFVVRRVGVYMYVAVFAILWAEVQFIAIFKPDHAVELVIITLSLTSLLANLAIAFGQKTNATLARTGLPLGVFLATVPVLCGLFLHFRATTAVPGLALYPLDYTYVGAMAVTAITCRVAAYLFRRTLPALSFVYFFATAAATMTGAGGLLIVANPGIPWEEQAPVLMAIPIFYLIAARLYRGHTPETPLVWVAHAATAVMLVSSIGTAFRGMVLVHADALNLSLAAFFTEAALLYLLAAIFRDRAFNLYLCTAMACAAVWQALTYFNQLEEYYTLVFAVVGLGLLVGYRFAPLEKYESRLPEAAFQCGHTLLLLAFGAASLIALFRLVAVAAADYDWNPLRLTLFGQVCVSLVALFLVRQQTWRQVYVATTVVLAALAILVVVWTIDLTFPRKVEVVSMAVGVILLGIGHFGWYREQERHNDLVSAALVLGCLLVAIPLSCAVIYCRVNKTFDTFHALNEIGMLAAGLLLLASGLMCRLKSTTLTGAVLAVVYLLTLVLLVSLPERLQTTAVFMMIGGGACFAVGLLLSIYRESLLRLPERVKRREGLFKVLTWR